MKYPMRMLSALLSVSLFCAYLMVGSAFAQNYNFPDNPTLNQIVTGPGGQQFQWDGTKWVAMSGVPNAYAPLTNPTGGQNNYAPLASPTLVSPTFNNSIPNGTALQYLSVIGCSTAASVGATCSVTLTWPSPFKDSAYAVLCTGQGTFGGVPIIASVSAQSATSALVWTMAASAAAASFQGIICMGIHP